MSDNQGVPEAAVEAALEMFWAKEDEPYIVAMRLALEAAAPHIAATRTVTTVEELSELAVGSVVLHNGRAFQHYPAYPAPFDEYQQWKCGDGGFVRSTKDGNSIIPATVLHEP